MSHEPSIYFKDVNERQGSFLRRTFLLGGAMALGIGVLAGRLGQLQVIERNRYATLASNNQFNFRLVPPPRGEIVDREGTVLAGNRPSFRVLVVRDETRNLDQTLDLLGRLLPDVNERRRTIIREVNAAPRFVPVPVKSDLNWEEFARVNLYANELPGVMVDMNEARYYPHGGVFAHVVGYVAKVADTDVAAIRERGEEVEQILYHPGYRIGRQGIERTLDGHLRGQAGGQRVEVDARGRIVGEDQEGSRPPTPGKRVELTLDADVQARAIEVFGDESGSAVVMNIETGDIVCMSSSPSFDPNLFVSGVPSRIYREWADYERRPLLDKALYGTFPPGSTFKMTTALALLDAGVNPAERVNCSGGYFFGNRTFRCHRRGGHGPQNMHDAIKNSCNVYFYHMCNRAGVDRIARVAEALGLHQTYDIGVPNQRRGVMPSTEWKRQAYRDPAQQRWFPGETLSVAIGQGAIEVNALQLAVMTARIANGRKKVNPRIIKSIGGIEQPSGGDVPDMPFSQEHLDIVRTGMAAVANDVSGTAYRASQLHLGDILMAGKTGTAQPRGGLRRGTTVGWPLRDHGLFVAFAPHDAPRYAIAVIVQHGGGSRLAAEKAREIMRVALLKDPDMRARIERPLPPEPTGPFEEEDPEAFFAPEFSPAPRVVEPTVSINPPEIISEPSASPGAAPSAGDSQP
jgi:penicillin-binding protein 2